MKADSRFDMIVSPAIVVKPAPKRPETVRSYNVSENTETAANQFLIREFAAELTPGDGRTVDVRIVPYGEKITHNDGLGGVPVGVDYQEEWLPGVFSHQLNAAHRVVANFEHQDGIGGIVGKGVTLREQPDGFYGSFRILPTQAGDTMLELLRDEDGPRVIDGVSLEARPVRNVKSGSVIQRAKANLHAIAFTRFAAYTGARVLAVREEQVVTIDEELLPVDLDQDIIEFCKRTGIKLPQRYKEHPEPDTPDDESGTPEDGNLPADNHIFGGASDEPHTDRAAARASR